LTSIVVTGVATVSYGGVGSRRHPPGHVAQQPTRRVPRASSAFLGALNAVDETPGDVDYTSVYSTTDTTSVAPTAVLGG
jgi:hypothetical protein